MAKSENVAIFNPLVLPLPSWHPDGPDGKIDGFVIPFVFPENRESGRQPNRKSLLRVYPTDYGWRIALRNCQDHAETPEQARAFAAAWIRAAEVLENVTRDLAEDQADGDVVDCEVVDDDEDQCFSCEERAVVDRPWGWQCTACGQWDVAQGKSRCKSRHDGSGRCIESAEHDGPCRFAADVDDVR